MAKGHKVETNAIGPKQKEDLIVEQLKNHKEGIYPKEVAFLTGINHSTVRSILIKLTLRGILHKPNGKWQPYYFVQNKVHSISNWNFQNMILTHQIEVERKLEDVEIIEDLDGLFEFTLKIPKNTNMATMRIASKYPPNLCTTRIIFYLFQRIIYESYGYVPDLDKIIVSTIEINRDSYTSRLDKDKAITGRTVISDLKLYDDGKRVREEYKVKIPIRSDLMIDMIDHGNDYVELKAVTLGNKSKINKIEKYLRKKKAMDLFERGVIKIKDIPENFKLTDKQKVQKDRAGKKTHHADVEKIKSFLESLEYPLYYLDFETFSTAIPLFDKSKPYQQIPFQFSLHIVKEKGAKPEHMSFLADGQNDPRPAFMQSLKDNLGDKGSIIVYYQSFEKGRIKEGMESFPKFEKWGNDILDRIIDLLHPFKNFHFYHPNQKGSASIKKVLPIFSKDVKYDDLIISNGLDASLSYYKSHFEDVPAKEKATIREALEKYCELDTYAEVILVDGLKEICGDNNV